MKHVHLPSALDITCQPLLHTFSLPSTHYWQIELKLKEVTLAPDFEECFFWNCHIWTIGFKQVCQNIAWFLNFSTFLSYQIWLIPLVMIRSPVWLHHKILKKETWLQLWILSNHYSKLKFGICCTLSSLLFKRIFYFWHFLVETKSKYF